jgi:hypothetical protein
MRVCGESADVKEARRKNTLPVGQPMGKLQWLPGFAADGGSIQAVYARSRCFQVPPLGWGRPGIRVKARPGRPLLFTHPTSTLRKLELQSFYFCKEGSPRVLPSEWYEVKSKRNPIDLTSVVMDLADADCDVVFLGRPDTPKYVTNIVKRYAEPAPHVALFAARDAHRTVLIPCSEILRDGYWPFIPRLTRQRTGLNDHLARDEEVIFNGYRYCTLNSQTRWYPMKALRHHARAEHEISQLLPRATAYGRLFGSHPFVIRPPIASRVEISGSALKRREPDGTTTIFFVRMTFHPPQGFHRSLEATRCVGFTPVGFGNRFVLPAQGDWPTYHSDCEDENATFWHKVFPRRTGPRVPRLFPILSRSSES